MSCVLGVNCLYGHFHRFIVNLSEDNVEVVAKAGERTPKTNVETQKSLASTGVLKQLETE